MEREPRGAYVPKVQSEWSDDQKLLHVGNTRRLVSCAQPVRRPDLPDAKRQDQEPAERFVLAVARQQGQRRADPFSIAEVPKRRTHLHQRRQHRTDDDEKRKPAPDTVQANPLTLALSRRASYKPKTSRDEAQNNRKWQHRAQVGHRHSGAFEGCEQHVIKGSTGRQSRGK